MAFDFFQGIWETPLGFAIFLIVTFILAEIIKSVISAGTSKVTGKVVKDEEGNLQPIGIVTLLLGCAVLLFIFQGAVGQFLGIDNFTVVILSGMFVFGAFMVWKLP